MDFDDFLQDKEGVDENEQGGEEAGFEEIPEDLFSDLSINVHNFPINFSNFH